MSMNEEKIIQTLLDHEERLERIEQNMLTKDEGRKMLDLLEGLTTTCTKIHEDHLFAVEWLQRTQSQVDRHEQDINKIKVQFKVA